MKKFLIILSSIITIVLFVACVQSNNTFDCGLFSFEYPPTFKSIPIQNVPHMVLKLESDSVLFSVSYWDNEIDGEADIWDDELYELYKKYPVEGSVTVEIIKDSILTKKGYQRCLKIKSNKHVCERGYDIDLKMLFYMLIHEGYLFTFSFTSPGEYNEKSATTYPDKIMEGLQFKHIPNPWSEIDNYILEVVKKLNTQCPIKANDRTTHIAIFLSGKSIMIKTLVKGDCNALDHEEFKRNTCKNLTVMVDKSFVQELDKNGYSLVYMIFNEQENLIKKIRISCEDILRYY